MAGDDGDVDLFVGGRVVAREYGSIPTSALLRNDGDRFVDVTDEIAPALRKELATGRPAHVPDAPTHQSLVATSSANAEAELVTAEEGR